MDVFGMFDFPLWLALLLVFCFILYRYLTANFNTWVEQGIPGPKPIPLFGTLFPMFSSNFFDYDKLLFKKYGKVFGTFEGSTPTMMIADTEMIKQIFVKDFQNFPNRRSVGAQTWPTRYMLSSAEGDHWRHMRSIISPTFSTGKLKQMMSLINKCATNLIKHLDEKAQAAEDVATGEFNGAYTMDAIAGTAFGIQMDSQIDKNNPMVVHAKEAFSFTWWNPIIWIIIFFPSTMKYLQKIFDTSTFPKKAGKFFSGVVTDAIKARNENTEMTKQLDFLQLMLDAEKISGGNEDQDLEMSNDEKPLALNSRGEDKSDPNARKGLTHEEVLANGLIFILAGYETTAATMSFLMYLLAVNPEKQDILFEEVNQIIGDKDTVDYEDLNKLKYLEMCIEETMRVYSPVPRTNRMCIKDTQVGKYLIKEGTCVNIVIYALHYDEEVWDDPELFKPERFTTEEKAKRSPYSWQPFGAGPRNCIGMRLAFIELKVAMSLIVSRYKIVPCEATEIPMKFKFGGTLTPAKPMTLRLEPRSS